MTSVNQLKLYSVVTSVTVLLVKSTSSLKITKKQIQFLCKYLKKRCEVKQYNGVPSREEFAKGELEVSCTYSIQVPASHENIFICWFHLSYLPVK